MFRIFVVSLAFLFCLSPVQAGGSKTPNHIPTTAEVEKKKSFLFRIIDLSLQHKKQWCSDIQTSKNCRKKYDSLVANTKKLIVRLDDMKPLIEAGPSLYGKLVKRMDQYEDEIEKAKNHFLIIDNMFDPSKPQGAL